MKKKLLLFTTGVLIFVLAGCNLKINLTPENNYFDDQTEQQQSEEQQTNADERIAYEVKANEDGVVMEILNKETGEVLTQDLVDLCGHEMFYYGHPQDLPFIILKPYSMEDEHTLNSLYSLDIQLNKCQPLEVSQQIEGNNRLYLSPDQTKVALVLEKNEARELKLLDLVHDKAWTLVDLPEGETLNGGYGGDSNHFDISWIDNEKIQYTVYEDTVKNYEPTPNSHYEKVLQVRVVSID